MKKKRAANAKTCPGLEKMKKKAVRTQKAKIKTAQQLQMGRTTDICLSLRHKCSFQSRLLP